MKIENADGCYFSMTVERYEFPDEELGPTEDNPADEFETGRFLIVLYTFRNADGEWKASGPTMTTVELQRFFDWLRLIRDGTRPIERIYFTERDLEFTCDDSLNNLSVHLYRDFLPPWKVAAEFITIGFPIHGLDLKSAVESLQTQLNAFPGRPPID